ncbi:nodulation receptor kinase-like isoform X2 [Phalaenopsis equestris]|uniref:nodulation receptor kinase-like isoform X2 n=1 Tax=Phalaenopsis equestris TaxID=78828 RepID=UPI0009E2FA7D|nr:nodulation receptor kinase-like isoform X2 [Phalaenopsis equestris]
MVVRGRGFVSIQCCSASNFTDQGTNITWTSDDHLFHSVGRCEHFSVSSRTSNHTQTRFFDEADSNNFCYYLPVLKGQGYLVRATFLRGPIPESFTAAPFNFSVGTTSISQIDSSIEHFKVEGVFVATNDHTNFCLFSETRNAYISTLELRPLNEAIYLHDSPSAALKLVTRVDLGNKNLSYRFPKDLADRIWPVDLEEKGSVKGKILESHDISLYGSNASIPIEVLQTAITDDEELVFHHRDLQTGHNEFLIILYFLELNANVQIGQRVFDIYVNGDKKYASFDILENESTSNYKAIPLRVKTNGFLNIALVKTLDEAKYGPICNAYEIYQILQRSTETIQRDVNAVMKLKDELMEENPKHDIFGKWHGDPCTPYIWNGLACEEMNGSFVIIKLDLSSSHLRGPFPSVIGDMTELKELDVQYNDFHGSIPDSLVALLNFSKLSIQCNPQLNYTIPPSLSTRKNLSVISGQCDAPSPTKSNIDVIGSVAGGSVAATFALGIFFSCFYKRPRRTSKSSYPGIKSQGFADQSIHYPLKNPDVKTFTLEYIKKATSGYQTLIGEGGFGIVYRGTLPYGQEVAVKVRSATSVQGTREFDNEVNLLSKLQHDNLVPLLGYCCENDQQILVYPYMSNGSLQERLYGEASKRKVLDWPTRLSIALGAARGLLYLHTYPGRCIIHRDVKSSNILLDQSMCGKVADFGFSKYAPQEGDSGASLEVRGTAGYLDPEYYSTQQLSTKSDVFSYGVVLLEIVTGREPLNIHRPRNEWSLVEWAKPFIREQRIDEMVDPNIKNSYHAEALWRVVEAALACIEPFSAYRPNMIDIVRELEDALIIENNASEYMRSIESFGGSNRFQYSIDRKIPGLPLTPSEPLSGFCQIIAAPQPR